MAHRSWPQCSSTLLLSSPSMRALMNRVSTVVLVTGAASRQRPSSSTRRSVHERRRPAELRAQSAASTSHFTAHTRGCKLAMVRVRRATVPHFWRSVYGRDGAARAVPRSIQQRGVQSSTPSAPSAGRGTTIIPPTRRPPGRLLGVLAGFPHSWRPDECLKLNRTRHPRQRAASLPAAGGVVPPASRSPWARAGCDAF